MDCRIVQNAFDSKWTSIWLFDNIVLDGSSTFYAKVHKCNMSHTILLTCKLSILHFMWIKKFLQRYAASWQIIFRLFFRICPLQITTWFDAKEHENIFGKTSSSVVKITTWILCPPTYEFQVQTEYDLQKLMNEKYFKGLYVISNFYNIIRF